MITSHWLLTHPGLHHPLNALYKKCLNQCSMEALRRVGDKHKAPKGEGLEKGQASRHRVSSLKVSLWDSYDEQRDLPLHTPAQ